MFIAKLFVCGLFYGECTTLSDSTGLHRTERQCEARAFRRSDVYFPGDKISYSTLDVDVILDEDMKIYEELHSWLTSLIEVNFSGSSDMRLNDRDKSMYDIALTILTSHNNLNRTIRYKDAFPTSIGNINFSSTQGGVQYVTVPVTFQFTTFSFV